MPTSVHVHATPFRLQIECKTLFERLNGVDDVVADRQFGHAVRRLFLPLPSDVRVSASRRLPLGAEDAVGRQEPRQGPAPRGRRVRPAGPRHHRHLEGQLHLRLWCRVRACLFMCALVRMNMLFVFVCHLFLLLLLLLMSSVCVRAGVRGGGQQAADPGRSTARGAAGGGEGSHFPRAKTGDNF